MARKQLTSHTRKLLQERAKIIRETAITPNSMERVRFYLRPAELAETLEYCIEQNMSFSVFCRDALQSKMKESTQ